VSVAADLASRYREGGFKVVRLRRDTKRPFVKGWQEHEESEEVILEWVEKGNPIGIQMGECSGWLSCIDLDWPESRALAPVFLHETLTGQKGSEIPSQYFYVCEDLPFAKFTGLNKRSEILSVKAAERGQGHQVAVAPSVHAEKGPYGWVDGYDPGRIARVEKADLIRQVQLLAAASLIAHVLPGERSEGEGGRHDVALAMAGFLLRDTAAKLEAGQEATGGNTLQDLLPGLPGKLATFLGFANRPAGISEPPVDGVRLRPLIETEDVSLQEAGDLALEAVLANNEPPQLFSRSGTPVRLIRDPREDEPQIRELSVDDTRVEVAQAADFVKSTGKTSKLVFVPRDVVTYVRSHRGMLNLPSIVGISRCPVVRPDGSILAEEGYDETTALWYAPIEGVQVPRVPEAPTQQDVDDALSLLWSWLGEFPYVDTPSATNVFALPLTLIVRPAIKGHVPLMLISKPSPGTGASLLIEAIATATLGNDTAGTVGAPSDDDAEMRKLITGALRQAKQLIFFDNVTCVLKHGSLARALTTALWLDRIWATALSPGSLSGPHGWPPATTWPSPLRSRGAATRSAWTRRSRNPGWAASSPTRTSLGGRRRAGGRSSGRC
jgi:hypothetical protein